MDVEAFSKRLQDWWRHHPSAIWVKATLFVVALLSLVIIAIREAVMFVERYWPKEKSLTVEEAFQVGQLAVLMLGLTSVVLLWKQGRDGAKWKRLLTYHDHFDDLPAPAARDAMVKTIQEVGAGDALTRLGSPLTSAQVAELAGNLTNYQIIKRYLDGFEQLCGAVNCRVIDEVYTRDLEGSRVIRIWTIFEPLIREEQKTNPRAYVEFEKVASNWQLLRTAEDSAHAEEDRKAQAQKDGRRLKSGVRPAAP
jgi:hypothetical protein